MFYLQCQLLKPLREISVFFEGEMYPTVSGVSRLITTLNATLNSEGPPSSWNLGITTSICSVALSMTHVLCMHTKYVYTYTSQSEYFSYAGVREWDELPSEVYECYLSLKTGFKTRLNPSSFLLTDAVLVHPGHKSLSWLEPTRREEAILTAV